MSGIPSQKSSGGGGDNSLVLLQGMWMGWDIDRPRAQVLAVHRSEQPPGELELQNISDEEFAAGLHSNAVELRQEKMLEGITVHFEYEANGKTPKKTDVKTDAASLKSYLGAVRRGDLGGL